MAKFTWRGQSSTFNQVFSQSDAKVELIKALQTARVKRQLSAAQDDGFFADWDQLVVDLETILRKNS